MRKKEHWYAIIGGAVGAVFTMVVCSFFPIGAQSQGDTFGDITCTGLRVVNLHGEGVIELSSTINGGTVFIHQSESTVPFDDIMSRVFTQR